MDMYTEQRIERLSKLFPDITREQIKQYVERHPPGLIESSRELVDVLNKLKAETLLPFVPLVNKMAQATRQLTDHCKRKTSAGETPSTSELFYDESESED